MATFASEPKGIPTSTAVAEQYPEATLTGKKSPGVQRIEAIATHFHLVDRIFLFLSIFLLAYAYGLDGTVRYTYQVCYCVVYLFFVAHDMTPGDCHCSLLDPQFVGNGQRFTIRHCGCCSAHCR